MCQKLIKKYDGMCTVESDVINFDRTVARAV